jgi:hypothetical protein
MLIIVVVAVHEAKKQNSIRDSSRRQIFAILCQMTWQRGMRVVRKVKK